jgi:hypothetical protein
MSFADARKSNFYNAVLGGRFAEEVSLRIAGQPDRTLWCTFSITASDEKAPIMERSIERAVFHCGRDESNELGGIAVAVRGMTVYRAADDVNESAWTWVNVVVKQTDYMYALELTRSVPIAMGQRSRA